MLHVGTNTVFPRIGQAIDPPRGRRHSSLVGVCRASALITMITSPARLRVVQPGPQPQEAGGTPTPLLPLTAKQQARSDEGSTRNIGSRCWNHEGVPPLGPALGG